MVQLKGGVSVMAFEVYDVNLCDYAAVCEALTNASEQAEKDGRVMTMARIAYVLGTTRQTVSSIADGSMTSWKGKKIPPEVNDVLKNAGVYCESIINDAGFAARNPAMSIFVLKAVHGYDDKPQSGANNSVTVVINDSNIPD